MILQYGITIIYSLLHVSELMLLDNIQCGQTFIHQDSTRKRIVGGEQASLGSFPWMVMLKFEGKATCGGSILNPNFILTAAHCFDDKTDLGKWRVYVGKEHKYVTDKTEVEHTLSKFIPHENYNRTTLYNDIALVMVEEPIRFTEFVLPICLPPWKYMKASNECYTTGWGETKGTGYEDVLKQVRLQTVHQILCRLFLQRLFNRKSKMSFCAGRRDADACVGDSGGPYSCKIENKWYIHGIVSYGAGCGQPNWPGVYVKVPSYTAWIKSKMTQKDKPENS